MIALVWRLRLTLGGGLGASGLMLRLISHYFQPRLRSSRAILGRQETCFQLMDGHSSSLADLS